MTTKGTAPRRLNGRFAFLQEFVRHPKQIQSVIPSSRFLEERIVQAADVRSARVLVELGPGTGGTTRALLRALPRHARLLSIEINANFHSLVSRIGDERLIAHLGSACELEDIIASYGLPAPDAVVSGIPFSAMTRQMGSQIVHAVSSNLAVNGRFVAYQVSSRVNSLCLPVLGPARSTFELRNIPPMRVFQWRKNGSGAALAGVADPDIQESI